MSSPRNLDPRAWIKARKSAGDNACVEQRRCDDRVEVRDTKARGLGPTLALSPAAFREWLAGARNGELDGLF